MKYLLISASIIFSLPGLLIAATPIEVIDDMGRRVVLQQPAVRIISLAPHITENLFTIGAGEQLVGVVNYSNYPEQALTIETVGGYDQFSIEKIVALNPDLVIAWHDGNRPLQIERLIELGLTVYIDEPQQLPDIARSLKRFGLLTGNVNSADMATDRYLHELEALKQRYAAREKISVFYQVWARPILTVGNDQIIGDVIRLCGGRNVFAELKSLTTAISIESVLQADPEAIIASGMDAARPEWLDDWTKWPFLSAVRNNHLYFIPPEIIQRHSTRLLDGTQRLCGYLEDARGSH